MTQKFEIDSKIEFPVQIQIMKWLLVDEMFARFAVLVISEVIVKGIV